MAGVGREFWSFGDFESFRASVVLVFFFIFITIFDSNQILLLKYVDMLIVPQTDLCKKL